VEELGEKVLVKSVQVWKVADEENKSQELNESQLFRTIVNHCTWSLLAWKSRSESFSIVAG
jgi:hypothetical protein